MKKFSFKGGIHPDDGKLLTMNKAVVELLPKGELVYSISQHIGVPANPIVAVGDKVLVGQIMAEATGFVSANVISSVSGVVTAIEPRLQSGGQKVTSIIVENDHQYTTIPHMGEVRDYKEMTKEEIRGAIKDAGIVGMGGAGFPTHVKLTPKDDDAIDYVIINGAECEPYLTSDYRMMLEQPEKIIGGLEVILSLFPKAKGVIGIEDNKPEAIKKLTELIHANPRISNIEVCPLKTKYPQGGERSLIYAITKRKIHSGKLPFEAGCIVNNIDTAIAIYMAVVMQTPLIRRIITVTGDAIKNPSNFSVKIGVSYEELLEEAGGFIEQPEKIISGGPMMGQALFSPSIPVSKVTSALTCFLVDEPSRHKMSPCIRCGRCLDVCPSRLVPPTMMEKGQKGDKEGFVAENGMECIECGCCSFICPAKRPLTQNFRGMRKMILAARKKK